jgi:hypothetical protein
MLLRCAASSVVTVLLKAAAGCDGEAAGREGAGREGVGAGLRVGLACGAADGLVTAGVPGT